MRIVIEVETANEKEHLAVSTLLKSILHILDTTVESRHAGNDFRFTLEGVHADSETKIPAKRHPLTDAIGV